MLPEPDSQGVEGGRVLFTFEGRPPSIVTVSLTPREVGLQRAEVAVSGRGSASFTQLVYP